MMGRRKKLDMDYIAFNRLDWIKRYADYELGKEAENIYRCLKCNRVYAGFLWALVHYIGKHLISDEELERMYKKFFGNEQ